MGKYFQHLTGEESDHKKLFNMAASYAFSINLLLDKKSELMLMGDWKAACQCLIEILVRVSFLKKRDTYNYNFINNELKACSNILNDSNVANDIYAKRRMDVAHERLTLLLYDHHLIFPEMHGLKSFEELYAKIGGDV
jgi:hypothetical protein